MPPALLAHIHAWVPVERFPELPHESTDVQTVYCCGCGAYGFRRWPRAGYFVRALRIAGSGPALDPDFGADACAGDFVAYERRPAVPPVQPYPVDARTPEQRRERQRHGGAREAVSGVQGERVKPSRYDSAEAEIRALDDGAAARWLRSGFRALGPDPGLRVSSPAIAPPKVLTALPDGGRKPSGDPERDSPQFGALGVDEPERPQLATITPLLTPRQGVALAALADAFGAGAETTAEADRIVAETLDLSPDTLRVYRHRIRTLVEQEEDMPSSIPVDAQPSEFRGPFRTPLPGLSDEIRKLIRPMTVEEAEDHGAGYSRARYRAREEIDRRPAAYVESPADDRARRIAALGPGPHVIKGLDLTAKVPEGDPSAVFPVWIEGVYETADDAVDAMDRLRGERDGWRNIYGITTGRARKRALAEAAKVAANETMENARRVA